MDADSLLDDLDYPSPDASATYGVIKGDARDLPIAEDSVDLIFTSPPYWKKRDYGHEDQIGQEGSLEDYVSNLMEAFDEWERVLRDSGTILLNIGDTYRNKSRMGIPWKVAEAARERGWRVRSEIIWHKPNGMPTASDDRFVNRHEHIFHFTPKDEYYFDKFGYNTVYDSPVDVWKVTHDQNDTHLAPFPSELVQRGLVAACPPAVCQSCGHPRHRKVEKSLKQLNEDRPQARRAMEIFEDSQLEEKHLEAIQATGIADAGKGREVQNGTGSNSEEVLELAYEAKDVLGGYFREFTFPEKTTVGWTECDCEERQTIPGAVLDPFAGSGTTIEVAKSMGLSAVGVDIDPSDNLQRYTESNIAE